MKSAAATLGLMTLSVFCLLEWSVVSGCTQRDRLFRDITQGHLKSVEPDNAVLKVEVSITCARQDKKNEEMATHAWEQLTWSDKRLAWNSEEYNDIENIRLPSHLIWLPDIKLYNSIAPVDERDQTNVVVSSDGTVIWVPSVLYRTHCDYSGSGIHCQINLGSWTYDADTVKLELTGSGVNLENYQNSTCPLAVESATAVIQTKYYPCCKEPYSHIEINLQLKRPED